VEKTGITKESYLKEWNYENSSIEHDSKAVSLETRKAGKSIGEEGRRSLSTTNINNDSLIRDHLYLVGWGLLRRGREVLTPCSSGG